VVDRDGTLIMVDDERMPLRPGEVPMMKKVRFRTLGCYPLSGAVESEADTLTAIIQEMLLTRTSERQGRMIDHDAAASMEKKKQETLPSGRCKQRPGKAGSAPALEFNRNSHGTRFSDLIATDIQAYLAAARNEEPAALHHLRLGRRRQEHPDRAPAV
jgi:hypothetical protein